MDKEKFLTAEILICEDFDLPPKIFLRKHFLLFLFLS